MGEKSKRAEQEAPQHLDTEAQGKAARKRRHRRVAATAVALVVAAGVAVGGYAAWQRYESAPATDDVAASNAAEQAAENAVEANANAGQPTANTTAPSDDAVDSNDTADTSDGNAPAEAAAPARQVGDHDAPTADEQAAMATFAQSVSVLNAPTGFTESAGYQELLYQAVVWQRAGRSLAFILTDLNSGATVSYNTDQVFYPASSIKGPYVCSLYEEIAEKGGDEATLDALAAKTIEDSDNDAFRQLHQTFGEGAFSTWLAAAGVPATAGHDFGYFTQYYYPHISCAQLNLMWHEIYRYCSSGTAPSKVLAGYFAARTTSPIAAAVGSRETSWGKAGWYYSSGDYGAEPATVDAGIVFGEKGPYQLVMMSDAPGELDAMAELAAGMDRAAADLA